jgi:hypothetical protein
MYVLNCQEKGIKKRLHVGIKIMLTEPRKLLQLYLLLFSGLEYIFSVKQNCARDILTSCH